MYKFEGIKEIERYGFPDGDYPVFYEIENGKPTGNKITPCAYIHMTTGREFLEEMGVKNSTDYDIVKNREVFISYDEDAYGELLCVTMEDISGHMHTVKFYIPEDVGEIDWDTEYAKKISKSI